MTRSEDNPGNPITTSRPAAGAPAVFDRRLLQLRRERARRQAARGGDVPRFLLDWAADDISDRLAVVMRAFERVASLGAFSGVVGDMLRERFPAALVIEAETVACMAATRGWPCVLADEEALPFADGALDLIVSGLSLQFVNDLPGALVQIRRALRPDGLFIGAMLGGGTLSELRAALTEAEIELTGGLSPRVAPFADVRDVGGLLQRAGLALPVTDSDVVDVTYETMFHLIRDLRGMGATNVLFDRNRAPAPRGLFLRAAEIYQDRFADADGRVRATFEIITMTAWAPDPSQQKPLQPGSAKSRLADALRTSEIPSGEKPGE